MSEPLIEERAHALFSPSSAYTWIACKAATAAQIGQPDESSEYADEGTAAHELAKWCLEAGNDTVAYMGRVITVGERQFEVDDEMADAVQIYVDGVRERIKAYELTGATVVMHVEQRLSIEHITGEKNAKGTSDCVLIATWANGEAEICVIDLKYGRGVAVSAEMNYQAMIYADGARYEHSDFYEFTSIRLVIHQVRVNEKPDEWVLTPAALAVWINTVAKPAAEQAMLYVDSADFAKLSLSDFSPGEAQCRFCKAKAVCPALAAHVEETLESDFDTIAECAGGDGVVSPLEIAVPLLDNPRLGVIYESLDLIDSWAKAVRGRIEHELLNGAPVPGVKLVQGRKGHRKWVSPEDSEAMLKSMRLKQEQMYNFKVISPTQAEKLLAEVSPRRWKKLEALITQAPGKPSVAPESDKRPTLELAPPADDFDVVTVDDGSDLA